MLSGGGARAAYQVGVLAAIADRVPDLEIGIQTGVSAGAINTITLSAHPGSFKAAVRALKNEWSHLTADRVYRVRLGGAIRASFRWLAQRALGRASGPTVVRGLMDMEPLRAFLSERVNFEQIDANVSSGRLHAAVLSATCYNTGETVTFVHGADDMPMWQRAQRRAIHSRLTLDHVTASSAIPILFPAVRIDKGYYGDGSVRQSAPLAPAVHLGASRILAVGMRPQWGVLPPPVGLSEYPSAAQVMGMLFHTIFLDALDADAERLERINETLASWPSGMPMPTGLRPVRLLVLRPSMDLGALARPHAHRLPPVIRSFVHAIGGQREGASDFVSYLLFDPAYTIPLMELGFDDANDQWDVIERFLAEE